MNVIKRAQFSNSLAGIPIIHEINQQISSLGRYFRLCRLVLLLLHKGGLDRLAKVGLLLLLVVWVMIVGVHEKKTMKKTGQ